MIITNLAGVFTGAGFRVKRGRHPNFADCGFIGGPVDIVIDETSGTLKEIEKTNVKNTSTFDGRGLIATPGFIDSHTHAIFAGERSHEFFMRWGGATYSEISKAGGGIHNTNRDTLAMPEDDLVELLSARLIKMRAHGSTTVEVKTGYGKTAEGELSLLRLLKKVRSRRHADWPDVFVTFLGLHALPKGEDEKAYVDSMMAILPTIQKESLADFIDAFPEQGFFSLAESLRFAEAGAAVGLKPKIHADEITDMDAAKRFTELRALSVDHLQQISASGVQALSQAETVATLMPATSFFLGLPYSDARKLIAAGARVALATDYNPGTAPRGEMGFTNLLAASQFKMSPAEILCAASYNAAGALGLDKNRGTLEKGCRADLLLWKTPKASSPEELLEHILLGAGEIQKVLSPG